MVVKKIVVDISTGNQDPDKDTRIFLGFDWQREFRLRKGNDANPFRENSSPPATELIFGDGNNVKNPELNDPNNPPVIENYIVFPYIRVSPQSTESWLIKSAIVTISGIDSFNNPFSWSYALSGPITLQEDAGEKVYLL
jgi:hypothetical protein